MIEFEWFRFFFSRCFFFIIIEILIDLYFFCRTTSKYVLSDRPKMVHCFHWYIIWLRLQCRRRRATTLHTFTLHLLLLLACMFSFIRYRLAVCMCEILCPLFSITTTFVLFIALFGGYVCACLTACCVFVLYTLMELLAQ